MVGIYKITSPTGRIYVGQSIDIAKRFNVYRLLHCKIQPKLYRSFIKHGVENHIFEIIEECKEYRLNTRERYWQDKFKVIGPKGLNCVLTETKSKKSVMSEETKRKIGLKHKGKIVSEETKARIKIAIAGKRNGRFHSKETRSKISTSNMGKKHSKESKIKMSLARRKFKVLNKDTGEVYESLKVLCFELNINYTSLKCRLTGKSINNTPYEYIRENL